MPYYLAPYVGVGIFLDPFRPRGSDQPGWSAIDLRPDGSVITGRCLLHLPVHDPDAQLLPLAHAFDDTLTSPRRRALETVLGVTLAQTRFNRIVEELLTLHARLDGSRWKPLRPMVDGRMRIYLGGLLSEWLPGSVGASISENWNCADSASLTCQLTWTEFTGTLWGITGNRAQLQSTSLSEVDARADSNLASDNHYAQATIAALLTGGVYTAQGVLCRKDSTSTRTFYTYRYDTSVTLRYLLKYVSGVQTILASRTAAVVVGDVIYVEADGSTITGKINGTVSEQVTDSGISGNLRCGIHGYREDVGTGAVALDTWSAADLVAAAGPPNEDDAFEDDSVIPWPLLMGGALVLTNPPMRRRTMLGLTSLVGYGLIGWMKRLAMRVIK